MLKYMNRQIYKINGYNPNTYICTYCYEYVLRMSLHQAHILLNNGVVELTIPLTNELSELINISLKTKQIFAVYIIVL